jgi:coenzyme PQQ precursor peptide PqqA
MGLTIRRERQSDGCHHIWRKKPMSWKSPKVIEVALGAEINSYACAETSK